MARLVDPRPPRLLVRAPDRRPIQVRRVHLLRAARRVGCRVLRAGRALGVGLRVGG